MATGTIHACALYIGPDWGLHMSDPRDRTRLRSVLDRTFSSREEALAHAREHAAQIDAAIEIHDTSIDITSPR